MSERDETAQPLGQAVCSRETKLAILVQLIDDGEDKLWILKSVVHDDSEVYGEADDRNKGQLVVKTWWAEKEGMI